MCSENLVTAVLNLILTVVRKEKCCQQLFPSFFPTLLALVQSFSARFDEDAMNMALSGSLQEGSKEIRLGYRELFTE